MCDMTEYILLVLYLCAFVFVTLPVYTNQTNKPMLIFTLNRNKSTYLDRT